MNWQPGSLHIEESDKHIYSCQYADPITRELICSWKYHYDQSAFEILKKKLRPSLVGLQHLVQVHHTEVIVPVVLHKRRLCERGFDQAVLISAFLSDEVGLPVGHLISRVRSTGHQVDREELERTESMKDSPFRLSQAPQMPRSVLLVDDVWTTGATIKAASEALLQAGVESIWRYTIAKG